MLQKLNGAKQRLCSNENSQCLGEPFGKPLPVPLLFHAQKPVYCLGFRQSKEPIFRQRIATDPAERVPPTVDDRGAGGTAMGLLTASNIHGWPLCRVGSER